MAPVEPILPENGPANPGRGVRTVVLPEPQPVAVVDAGYFERRVEQLSKIFHLEIAVQDPVLAQAMEIDGDDGLVE